jgi:hypothetical protein
MTIPVINLESDEWDRLPDGHPDVSEDSAPSFAASLRRATRLVLIIAAIARASFGAPQMSSAPPPVAPSLPSSLPHWGSAPIEFNPACGGFHCP